MLTPYRSRPGACRRTLLSTTALGTGALVALTAAAVVLTAPPASANPKGGKVVRGDAAISSPGVGQLDIRQSSDRAVINWDSFSIGRGEVTRFRQPSRKSITLNRVTGSGDRPSLSEIAGRLEANGNVMLINPSGVVFTETARIDVGGLIASTSDLDDDHFMSTTEPFRFVPAGDPDAVVRNDGAITVADGGMAALVAPYVVNNGTITARLGRVVLASGETHTVDLYGDGLIHFEVGRQGGSGDRPAGAGARVRHDGAIFADGGLVELSVADASGIVDRAISMTGMIEARSVTAGGDGRIVLHGGDQGTVRVAGRLDASGAADGVIGGEVVVSGERVVLAAGSEVDVSGPGGGGRALIGGAFGGAPPLPQAKPARETQVAAGATLDADATAAGDGGTIVAWADDTTIFNGTATARGGPLGGNGGFIETSGRQGLGIDGGAVDVSAAAGAPGTWLLDPTNVFIVDNPSSEPDFGRLEIEAASISKALDDGADVIITTDGADPEPGTLNFSGGGEDLDISGNISVEAGIQKVSAAPASLTLTADNDIDIGIAGSIGSTSGPLTVNLTAGGAVESRSVSPLATSGGDLTISAGDDRVQVGDITTSGGAFTSSGGAGFLGTGSIDTGSGPVSLTHDGITVFGSIAGGAVALAGGEGFVSLGSVEADSLDVDGSGIELFSDVSTTGSQTYRAPVEVLDIEIASGEGDIAFNGALDASSGDDDGGPGGLTVVSGGRATFSGAIGSSFPLDSLAVSADTIELASVTMAGGLDLSAREVILGGDLHTPALFMSAQTRLATDVAITDGESGIIFDGPIDGTTAGAESLVIDAGGNVVLRGVVGATTPLGSLDIDGSIISLTDVTTLGPQTYTASEALGLNSTFLTGGSDFVVNGVTVLGPGLTTIDVTVDGTPQGGDIAFNGPVDGDGEGLPPDLTLVVGQFGNITFTDPVGGTVPLGTLIRRRIGGGGDVVLDAADAAGLEDAGRDPGTDPIALSISVDVGSDADSPVITISGIPEGAEVLIDGEVVSEDGTATVTVEDLDALAFRPTPDSDETVDLGVAAAGGGAAGFGPLPDGSVVGTLIDDVAGGGAAVATITIDLEAVADEPLLVVPEGTVDAVPGVRTPIAITAESTDVDGSESVEVTLSNLPAGTIVRVGDTPVAANDDGSFTIPAEDLPGLTVEVTAGPMASFPIDVVAAAIEAANLATAEVADTFTLRRIAEGLIEVTASSPGGDEDAAIVLLIEVTTDLDGTPVITVSNVPDGATLSAGTDLGGGVWELSEADLAALSITPALNDDTDLSLLVEAAVVVGGSTFSASAIVPVEVEAVADTPILDAPDEIEAVPGVRTPVAITAEPSDTDGSESVSVTLSGLPAGTVVRTGDTVVPEGEGGFTVAAEDLPGLTVEVIAGPEGPFPIDVVAIAIEIANQDTAEADDIFLLRRIAEGLIEVTASSPGGLEDTPIVLVIEVTTDLEGEQVITVSNVPGGATLSAGTNLGGGVWELSEADLAALSVTPAPDDATDLSLLVEAAVLVGEATFTDEAPLPVEVAAVADAPSLDAPATATVPPRIPGALEADAATTDTDGSETVEVVIDGLPADATLSAGTRNPDGSFTVPADALDGLTVTVAAADDARLTLPLTLSATSVDVDPDTGLTDASDPVTAALTLNVVGIQLAAGDASGLEDQPIALDLVVNADAPDGDQVLTITGVPDGATLSAGDDLGGGVWELGFDELAGLTLTPAANDAADFALGTSASVAIGGETLADAGTVAVTVAAVADAATLEVPDALAAPPRHPVVLPIEAATPDTDGSESVEVVITGLPPGATLSAGTRNPDGSFTVPADALEGLTVTVTAADDARLELPLSLRAVATDVDPDDGAIDTGPPATADLTLRVVGVRLVASSPGGAEDQPIPLSFVVNDDSPAGVPVITVRGVPSGARLSAGQDLGGGAWRLSPDQLAGLALVPRANDSRDVELRVEARTRSGEETLRDRTRVPVEVRAETDPIILTTPGGATIRPGVPRRLEVTATTTDTDGSERVRVRLDGLPEGARLSAGTRNPDGSFTLPADALADLTVLVPVRVPENFRVDVMADARDVDPETGPVPRDGIQRATGSFLVNVESGPGTNVDQVRTTQDRLASPQNPTQFVGRGRPARPTDTTPATPIRLVPVEEIVPVPIADIAPGAGPEPGVDVEDEPGARRPDQTPGEELEPDLGGGQADLFQLEGSAQGLLLVEVGSGQPGGDGPTDEEEAVLLELEQIEACPDVTLPTVAWQNTATESAFNVDPQLVPYSVDVFCAGYKLARPGRGALVEYEGMTFVLEDFWTDLDQSRQAEPLEPLKQSFERGLSQ